MRYTENMSKIAISNNFEMTGLIEIPLKIINSQRMHVTITFRYRDGTTATEARRDVTLTKKQIK